MKKSIFLLTVLISVGFYSMGQNVEWTPFPPEGKHLPLKVNKPKPSTSDTVFVIMQVSDTSSFVGQINFSKEDTLSGGIIIHTLGLRDEKMYRDNSFRWQYGYHVSTHYYGQENYYLDTRPSVNYYLDENKKPLKSSIIVWQSFQTKTN